MKAVPRVRLIVEGAGCTLSVNREVKLEIPMRYFIALGFALLAIVSVPLAAAQSNEPEKTDKKALEAQAKELVAEGRVLEQQGKLAEAKDKYVDAEGVTPTDDALSAIHHINDAEKQQVESLLNEARHLYETGKLPESAQQLRQGLELDPTSAALRYNLALCFLKLGDRANAALQLDLAVGSLPNRKDEELMELLELRSTVLMGTQLPAAAASGDAKKNLSAFNSSYVQEDRDPGDTKAPGGSLCDQAKTLDISFPTNAAVVFNAAKCAEEDARPEDAAHQIAEYLKLAPEALDHTDAELLTQSWISLAALTGDAGQAVRKHFATAARYLDYRRYDRAIAEYEGAAQALPDYPETERRLGLLYEAYGNVAKAREHFSRYLQLEADPARKNVAEAHLSSLDRRRAIYDANIEEAQDILTNLLQTSMGLETEGTKHKTKLSYRQWRWASGRYKKATRATVRLPEPYVERELSHARENLEDASELFPLGAEAGELLGLICLQGNNWPAAFQSYDAVASQGFPVSFFAQVNSAHENKVVRATKVEISNDAIRLVYLSVYDPKTQLSVPPKKPPGEDGLGNLVVSAGQPPDMQAESLTIHAAELKGVETDKSFVVLKLTNDKVYLSPLNMLSSTPFEGGASRSFGNEYTRLFVRYLGYESAKLGKEGMTTGEKFKLGFEVARIGVSIGMMGVGAPMAYGSALRMARLVHALQTFHSVAQGARGANIAEATTRLADDVQMSSTALEQTVRDEQRVIQSAAFKVIPTQPLAPKFREKF
jgi:tetratricopeptide (TPR) repeat protein